MKSSGLKTFAQSHRSTLVCLLLTTATSIVYSQLWHCDFTNYDDSGMVTDNPMVVGGLTLRGFCWALTTFYHEYWHPLTWLSHMLDCQLFGLRPGWHHLASLGLHVANALLLFGILERMTGAWKRSAMVVALFALHPLHVESVAWIAERKDVLSGFFFMLTLWAYARYAQTTVISSQSSVISNQLSVISEQRSSGDHRLLITEHRSLLYLLSLVFFALGLMCKPMLMTLPFVLLLLDFWPLRRFGLKTQDSRLRTLVVLMREKLPFFALTAVSCALAYAWARGSDNLLSTGKEPWGLRLSNVPISYARYLRKMIWPNDLILPYPMPSHWPWWQTAGAVLVVVLITVFAVRRVRVAPYLIVGWLIFLGVLVPTIRLVQAGFQSIADRYTYIPSIGIYIAVVWAAADWGRRGRVAGVTHAALGLQAGRRMGRRDACSTLGTGRTAGRTALLAVVAAVALMLCSYRTWGQVGIWRNSFTLWNHCLAVCPDNTVARANLGSAFLQKGDLEEATKQFLEEMRLDPALPYPYTNLGKVYALQGKLDDAMAMFAKAIALNPELEEPHFNLGNAYLIKGKLAEVTTELKTALRLKPINVEGQGRLAEALIKMGRAAEALPYCEAVVQARPQDAHARYALGEACLAEKLLEQAVASLKEAVRLAPDVPECLNALAWVYATCPKAELRNGAEAIRLAEKACEITNRQKAPPLDTLAAAYAETGQFAEAARTAEEARALAVSSHDTAAVETARQRSELYRAGKPYRDE